MSTLQDVGEGEFAVGKVTGGSWVLAMSCDRRLQTEVIF